MPVFVDIEGEFLFALLRDEPLAVEVILDIRQESHPIP